MGEGREGIRLMGVWGVCSPVCFRSLLSFFRFPSLPGLPYPLSFSFWVLLLSLLPLPAFRGVLGLLGRERDQPPLLYLCLSCLSCLSSRVPGSLEDVSDALPGGQLASLHLLPSAYPMSLPSPNRSHSGRAFRRCTNIAGIGGVPCQH